MLLSRHLAEVVDVNRGKHDALHLTAYLADGLQKHLVPCQTGDSQVKCRIGLDKSQASFPVLWSARDLGKFRQLLQGFGSRTFCGSEFGGGTFHRAAKFVNVVEYLQADVGYEISTIGHDAQQPVVLQPHCGLANRRPAGLVTTREIFFTQGLARLENTIDDVVLERGIDFFAESGGGKQERVFSRGKHFFQRSSVERGRRIAASGTLVFFLTYEVLSKIYFRYAGNNCH